LNTATSVCWLNGPALSNGGALAIVSGAQVISADWT
jgi:hypothetical protein